MKIACLALIRMGYPVHVETGGPGPVDHLLRAEGEWHCGNAGGTMAAGQPQDGTVFHIIGYKGDAFADRFAVNLPQSAIIAEGPSRLISLSAVSTS